MYFICVTSTISWEYILFLCQICNYFYSYFLYLISHGNAHETQWFYRSLLLALVDWSRCHHGVDSADNQRLTYSTTSQLATWDTLSQFKILSARTSLRAARQASENCQTVASTPCSSLNICLPCWSTTHSWLFSTYWTPSMPFLSRWRNNSSRLATTTPLTTNRMTPMAPALRVFFGFACCGGGLVPVNVRNI